MNEQSGRKTLVLTGASRGIGHATVKRFSREGWRVITCSRKVFDDNCPWPAGPDDHIKIDLSDPEDVGGAVSEIRHRIEKEGGHNAGISPKTDKGQRLNSMETPMHIWRDVFQVNFFAPIMLARGLFKELKAGKGSIVNVTSIAGSRVHPFAGTAYATSKAALSSLTREMAADFGPHGIRVNAIAPGRFYSKMTEYMSKNKAAFDEELQTIPMRRWGEPSDIAGVAIMLASQAGAFITGQIIPVDGGTTLVN